ncbi:hypothetical protein ACOSP7_012156 [Xanthoceras sorbifolium]
MIYQFAYNSVEVGTEWEKKRLKTNTQFMVDFSFLRHISVTPINVHELLFCTFHTFYQYHFEAQSSNLTFTPTHVATYPPQLQLNSNEETFPSCAIRLICTTHFNNIINGLMNPCCIESISYPRIHGIRVSYKK